MPTVTTNQAELDAIRVMKAGVHKNNYINEVGGLFYVTHQTPGTNITGQTSFVATTPTFLLYGENVDYRAALKRVQLSQTGTVAGGVISVSVAIDTANRYSSGGTAIVPQQGNSNKSRASVWTFRYNPTASAAGSGTRYLWTFDVKQNLNDNLTLDFTEMFEESGLLFAAAGTTLNKFTGSLLIYTWAGTTGPTWKANLEFFED